MTFDKLPYQDFTIKAIVTDVEKKEEILRDLNATYLGVDHQKDIYFNVPKGKLKWRQGTIENLITHYERLEEHGLEKTIVYRYDLNPTQKDIDKLYIDSKEIGAVEKERKIFYIGNVKIHLDKTKDNKSFIEIEAIDREEKMSGAELKEQCLRVKVQLKIKDEDLIKTGYHHAG